MENEYVKFCFVSYKKDHYTSVIRCEDLKKSYKIAKKNIINRLMKKFGRYNITDVSFRLKNDKWNKISWPI